MQDRERGRGLGLAIVKHLVKLMGGQLSIQSQESRSTKVKVMLPMATEEDGLSFHLAIHKQQKKRPAYRQSNAAQIES